MFRNGLNTRVFSLIQSSMDMNQNIYAVLWISRRRLTIHVYTFWEDDADIEKKKYRQSRFTYYTKPILETTLQYKCWRHFADMMCLIFGDSWKVLKSSWFKFKLSGNRVQTWARRLVNTSGFSSSVLVHCWSYFLLVEFIHIINLLSFFVALHMDWLFGGRFVIQ